MAALPVVGKHCIYLCISTGCHCDIDELFVYLEQMKRERSEMQRDAASPVFEVGTGFVSPTVMKVGISTFTVSWDSDRDRYCLGWYGNR